jgi:hypothetical protein
MFFYFPDFSFQVGYAFANTPAVNFQPCFTRSPGADAAAQAGHFNTPPGKTGQEIIELGKLNLQLALPCFGPAGKYIQDQLGPVNNPYTRDFLQVAGMDGGKLPVKNRQAGAMLTTEHSQFLNFAPTEKSGIIRLVPFLDQPSGNISAGCIRQTGQFLKGIRRLFRVVPGQFYSDEDSLFSLDFQRQSYLS